jgi:hypothetical protein
MKKLRILLSFVVLLTASFALAQADAQKSFDQLKMLAGSWDGKSSDGMPLNVTFEDTAGGSALLSQIHGHGADNMISMIHLDANRLVLTHYCSIGNQPRMAATASPDGKTITFDFFDATNLASPDAGHMQRVVIAIVDANHHTEEWTFVDHGKQTKEYWDLRRKA